MPSAGIKIGAFCLKDRKAFFSVWAPLHQKIELHIVSPKDRIVRLQRDDFGYWSGEVEDVSAGARYLYCINGQEERPDPASFFQPETVHGPSEIIDHGMFKWEDEDWLGIPLEEMVIYEIHTGTFTPEGTFEAAGRRLDDLSDLGMNAIEIMPVAQFPGTRNWGYDGVYPFAVQNSYGGPEGLKKLVSTCHKRGFAVILDVVYNHLGPEGNYLADFAPYFSSKYRSPWGDAVNYDDAYSCGVRNYFIQNALYWLEYFHIDALRLDAVHGIFDRSAKHILEDMQERVEGFSQARGRKSFLIAESDLNDVRIIAPLARGGYGLSAQWNDDFHHCVHTLLTGEKEGYYQDFGKVDQLINAYKEGFVYSWLYSGYRKRFHGSDSKKIPALRFVVFIQNHDQVGNRMMGERLSSLVSFEACKLAAGSLLVSPYIPLLFMGEEYGEESPFLYFISHHDEKLVEAVRNGRREEFESFQWKGEPPDPYDERTFQRSRLKWERKKEGKHKILFDFYKALIRCRRSLPSLFSLSKERLCVEDIERESVVFLKRWYEDEVIFCIMNFMGEEKMLHTSLPVKGRFRKLLDSSEVIWNGSGTELPDEWKENDNIILRPFQFALYQSQ
ncbi:MAG: malto-oligosyltrehalose trehalohydrolase [Candidatus Aureabacteria bacterium]|nr:malto-oligosyltrehalose trehalohydrolase [Candidatus Auribacterota bacterium]